MNSRHERTGAMRKQDEREVKKIDDIGGASVPRIALGLILVLSPFLIMVPCIIVLDIPVAEFPEIFVVPIVLIAVGVWLAAPGIFWFYFKGNVAMLLLLSPTVVMTRQYAAAEVDGWYLFVLNSRCSTLLYFARVTTDDIAPATKVKVPGFSTIRGRIMVAGVPVHHNAGLFSIPTPNGIVTAHCRVYAINTVRDTIQFRQLEDARGVLREVLSQLSRAGSEHIPVKSDENRV